MKLFVADSAPIGYASESDYHWCEDGEILMFGQFQTDDNRKGNEFSMCGIMSRKFTTNIVVRDLSVSRDFVLDLITESVERSMHCMVNDDGSYDVDLGDGWGMSFNINDILEELLSKASEFKDGDRVICRGRVLTKR